MDTPTCTIAGQGGGGPHLVDGGEADRCTLWQRLGVVLHHTLKPRAALEHSLSGVPEEEGVSREWGVEEGGGGRRERSHACSFRAGS